MQTIRLERRMKQREQRRTRRREWKARAALAAQMTFFGAFVLIGTVMMFRYGYM